jgi:hypothetical protein
MHELDSHVGTRIGEPVKVGKDRERISAAKPRVGGVSDPREVFAMCCGDLERFLKLALDICGTALVWLLDDRFALLWPPEGLARGRRSCVWFDEDT